MSVKWRIYVSYTTISIWSYRIKWGLSRKPPECIELSKGACEFLWIKILICKTLHWRYIVFYLKQWWFEYTVIINNMRTAFLLTHLLPIFLYCYRFDKVKVNTSYIVYIHCRTQRHTFCFVFFISEMASDFLPDITVLCFKFSGSASWRGWFILTREYLVLWTVTSVWPSHLVVETIEFTYYSFKVWVALSVTVRSSSCIRLAADTFSDALFPWSLHKGFSRWS